jgi:hypothetical protein
VDLGVTLQLISAGKGPLAGTTLVLLLAFVDQLVPFQMVDAAERFLAHIANVADLLGVGLEVALHVAQESERLVADVAQVLLDSGVGELVLLELVRLGEDLAANVALVLLGWGWRLVFQGLPALVTVDSLVAQPAGHLGKDLVAYLADALTSGLVDHAVLSQLVASFEGFLAYPADVIFAPRVKQRVPVEVARLTEGPATNRTHILLGLRVR